MKVNLSILVLMALALWGCSKQAPPEEEAQMVQEYTIEQFFGNTSIGGSSFSHDYSKILFSSDESGIYNVYSVPIEGGEPIQLTQSDSQTVFASAYFPHDDRFLFRADNNGDEINHIFMQTPEGEVSDLTPWEGARSNFYGWNRERTGFFFGSNKRDNKFVDVYEMDIETFEPTMIYQNDAGMDFTGMSNDKRYFALSKTITTSSNELYIYDTETKEMKLLAPANGNSYSASEFSLDNKTFYFTTNEGNEYMYLAKYDLESGEKEEVFKADWDVMYAYSSFNEKYRIIGINEDGRNSIKVFEIASGKEVQFPSIEGGDITSVNIGDNEEVLTFYAGASNMPSNLFFGKMGETEASQLTNTLNPEINAADLVTAEVIRYPSFDGLEIPSILYKPHNATADNKVPALVWVHGGPGGQTRANYSAIMQYFANHGYVVLGVNNRGSSGYGKTFNKMDDQKHGDVDLKDCIWAKEYFKSLGYVDTTKVGIIGGSYGGYMTAAAMAFAPDEFEVGVDIFGVTNWIRTLRSIPPWWESFKDALYEEMGNPYGEDSIALYNKSPLFHAENIKKPMMVLQGANDPRVLKAESDEIVEAVKNNGVPVEYVVFDDEGHGFSKKENRIKGYGDILAFLDKYLKKEVPEETEEQQM
ncbi:prolyl oligopeptidase family serine peptidase [Flammeovirgaceae bacterium SG7u.111]|nr:prolyl oligopeptidase family serine peptidase [Flammeovirgaceae bacterium SG7u.132]WPO37288.1 prolyl oligopeptidase family serine peptidase [Flammeovirgaceae bacterium SG7u.111]